MKTVRHRQTMKGIVTGIAVAMLPFPALLFSADTAKPQPAKYCAVIIQAAGYLPGEKKPEGTDAITHATTKGINTYVVTEKLVDKLAALGAVTNIVAFSDCPDLGCLCPVEEDGRKRIPDLVVFAGPSYYSKQPKQLLALFPKLGRIVELAPDIVCSSLVPAWFPDTHGQKTIEHSDRCFKAAGARTVMGISMLTPRKNKPGISEQELDKIVTNFAASLIAEVAKRKKK